MIKRQELRDILQNQVVQELDSEGKPTKTFDCELKRITKRICAINEYIKPNAKEVTLPLVPVFTDPLIKATTEVQESSESEDEEFDWYQSTPQMLEETYFCLTNMQRAPMKKGDQAFNCYGNRSNRFLLMDYGFAFSDNHYDSVELFLNMTGENKTAEIH